ncbi:hypothetical protein [Sinorhizobium psoraleae]|uniref:hypothetical protein n=1 Tax=Sinorhizobium psoraleae TaxID=520838 RepID=UPI001AED8B87|nr:hypothetical protein [Sinorhizobium psoraleae]
MRASLPVAAEIVEDDDIAPIEGWCQALLDPGGEGGGVDRAVSTKGATMRSWRSPARKVSVFQWPCAISGWPR